MSTATAAAPNTIEGLILSLINALNRVADNQDRLLAGQEAAIEKIEGNKPGRTRKKADTPAADAAPEAAAETPAAEPEGFTLPAPADIDAFKTYVGEWTGQVEGAARDERIEFLKSVAAAFNGSGFSGAFGGGAKAIFYIERAKALGVKAVDFKADYDFDGDPSQEAAAGSSDDEFG